MRLLPEIPCLESSGEATALPAHSVDLVTVAQAFHWLDEEKFKKEMMRILRPEGKTYETLYKKLISCFLCKF